MKGDKKGERGFTLIELTVVVCIIGILAAIAIPNFLKFIAKARQTEAKVIIASIASAEMQNKIRSGVFVSCPKNPPEPRGQWNAALPEWNRIGFAIRGPAFYQYEVVATETEFVVYARGNVDKDLTMDEWEISSKDLSPRLITDDTQN